MTVPGAESAASVHSVWIEIDHHEARRPIFAERGQDVLDAGLGGKLYRRLRQPQPLGPQPDLRYRLFAGDIDDGSPRLRQRAGSLEQERRLADAGIAADEERRAAHEAAAGDAVELGHAGLDPGRLRRFAGERGKRDDTTLARFLARPGGDAARGSLLDERVPLTAIVATPLPAGRDPAAVLADKLCGRPRHAITPQPKSRVVLYSICSPRGSGPSRGPRAMPHDAIGP